MADLRKAFGELSRRVKPQVDWLYETKCDRCGGRAVTESTVYSKVFQCPRCLAKIPLFDCVKVEATSSAGKPKQIRVCPHCHAKGKDEHIKTTGDQFGSIPVLVSYLCENGCKPADGQRAHNDADKKKRAYFEKHDLAKLQDIASREIPHWYPDADLAENIPYRMLHKQDFRPSDATRLVNLFTKRNLWALACHYQECGNLTTPHAGDIARFGLNAILLAMSRLQGFVEDPRFPNQLMRGTYYIPQIGREYNVVQWLEGKLANLAKGYDSIAQEAAGSQIMVSTQSAVNLAAVKNNSVDYVFTDPPYGDNVQYGELNFIWESWLGFDTNWRNEEIIVSGLDGHTESDWANMMSKAMAECYRVLKPGRWLSLCYHDTSEGTWALVQDIMAGAGFLVDKSDSAVFIDTSQKSYNQRTADKVNKRDLVINFRKPKPDEVAAGIRITGTEDRSTFSEKVRAIVREHLTVYPGSTKDRIYDEVVSKMVRSGQMEAHNFDEVLHSVAEEVKTPVKRDLFRNEAPNLFGTHEVGRWYLKEVELDVSDAAESAKEDAAAEKLGPFIKAHLKKHPEDEGVHYSDLFEQYVYSLKEKPRRHLADFLPDYFYKTDAGTWRLPASPEEAKAKAESRAKGTGRRVKRYIALLEQGVAISDHDRPNDASLAEWIRHCKRSGLYEQGKLLYEKGGIDLDKLPEEVMVGVEEDYQVCVRMLARSAEAKPAKKRKGAKE